MMRMARAQRKQSYLHDGGQSFLLAALIGQGAGEFGRQDCRTLIDAECLHWVEF
jgi:hypothetical protein